MRRRHCLAFLIALDHHVLGHIPRYLHWIVYLSLYPHSTPRRRNRSDTFPLEPIALSFVQLLILLLAVTTYLRPDTNPDFARMRS